ARGAYPAASGGRTCRAKASRRRSPGSGERLRAGRLRAGRAGARRLLRAARQVLDGEARAGVPVVAEGRLTEATTHVPAPELGGDRAIALPGERRLAAPVDAPKLGLTRLEHGRHHPIQVEARPG